MAMAEDMMRDSISKTPKNCHVIIENSMTCLKTCSRLIDDPFVSFKSESVAFMYKNIIKIACLSKIKFCTVFK